MAAAHGIGGDGYGAAALAADDMCPAAEAEALTAGEPAHDAELEGGGRRYRRGRSDVGDLVDGVAAVADVVRALLQGRLQGLQVVLELAVPLRAEVVGDLAGPLHVVDLGVDGADEAVDGLNLLAELPGQVVHRPELASEHDAHGWVSFPLSRHLRDWTT